MWKYMLILFCVSCSGNSNHYSTLDNEKFQECAYFPKIDNVCIQQNMQFGITCVFNPVVVPMRVLVVEQCVEISTQEKVPQNWLSFCCK